MSPNEAEKPLETPEPAKPHKEKYFRCAAGRLKQTDMVLHKTVSAKPGRHRRRRERQREAAWRFYADQAA